MDFTFDKIRRICEELAQEKEQAYGYIDGFVYAPCAYKGSKDAVPEGEFVPFEKGSRMIGRDSHFLLKNHVKTPKEVTGKRLFFRVTTGYEGGWDAENPQCLVYVNGHIVQGLDVNHRTIPLEYDTEYDLEIYFYVGMITTYTDFIPEWLLVDTAIEKLYYDIHVPLEAAGCLDREDSNYILTMKYLNEAVKRLNLMDPYSESFYESISEADRYLLEEYYGKICGKSEAVVSCIGHTHIDVAWLWTVAQTREKAQRSFSTVLSLMEQYPEYKFMSSQPQLYEFVKEDAPEVYERLKQAVKEKRWEPEGAMWLEADCNLTSGESLVRQILYGKRFMKEEFGVDNKSVWLPDVFGYSAALPQIMKKCGIDYFVTSKISWNETNKMPHDSFLWQGIDGTGIFTYFLTAQDLTAGEKPQNQTTYVGYIRPSQVLGTWKRYQDKKYNQETLLTFGYGDGGGGPTADMLEQQRRLSWGLPGFPKTQISFSHDFLERVKTKFDESTALYYTTPKWVGELYLELHRGTYTSIAKNKRNNRKSELLCQALESAAVMDEVLLEGVYPKEELHKAWKTILLNQFHDIIPGSSIYEVYQKTDEEYAALLAMGGKLYDGILQKLAEEIDTQGGLLVYNPTSFTQSGIADYEGRKLYVRNIPGHGYRVVKEISAGNGITYENKVLETPFYQIIFDEEMNMISLYDKEMDRQAAAGKMNQIRIYEDYPRCWDAWDISNYYPEKEYAVPKVDKVTAQSCGNGFCITVEKSFLQSHMIQRMYVYEDSRRIDFDMEMDWDQAHQLMKIAFPIAVHATEASYDIQFGNIKRPTHRNTSWDQAKFEVCAHKWADLSEDDYGVSILNDCKYGYSAEENTLYLTALKCATYPNPQADKEHHQFSYAIYPHAGSFKQAGVVKEAALFNSPFQVRELKKQTGKLPEAYSLVTTEAENIVIDTLKKAEDGEAYVLRLYECFDRRGKVKLTFGFEAARVFLCNMLEEEERLLDENCEKLTLPVKNYEIVTLKIYR